MSIIEREIEKRELLMKEKDTLTEQLKRLQEAMIDTQARLNNIDEITLAAEIEELKSYLPQTEDAEEIPSEEE